ncbi:MAG: ARMT1-like domain-containing protein [Desulfobacterales bacterium]|nr:ARMT1-like domain-containing protein [Desulfobacterales bacterium]
MTSNPAGLKKHTDPDQDAWLTAFFIENHIDPFAYPNKVGSREQTEFMVYPESDSRYYPCSQATFEAIMSRKSPKTLMECYQRAFERVTQLVDDFIEIDYDKAFLKSLIQMKYQRECKAGILIPSRLEKRLYKIFISRTHIENPHAKEKQQHIRQAHRFLNSPGFEKALNHIKGELKNIENLSLKTLRKRIKEIELKRLLTLMGAASTWQVPQNKLPGQKAIQAIFKRPITGNGLPRLTELMHRPKSKFLWLTNTTETLMLDLRIAEFLSSLGHVVILAVKESPFFKKVCLTDTRTDPILSRNLTPDHFIHEKTISKNDLVQRLKQDKNIHIISDGTREDLNLLLTSTTFARVFKEVDCIIAQGPEQKRRLIQTPFRFTRDILHIDARGDEIQITHKPAHPGFINFTHLDLEEKAGKIIQQMKDAKAQKMTVMFYSGIIGSIPGKIDVAKKIMGRFIRHLESRSTHLFIINPSLYYEPGMDADDLMYMWEIVQRSGEIDIWRFQTADDIAESFRLMRRKVPPEWVGKDATYSTGCTKEIRIAMDVLKEHPEMQLIGPSVNKFMRRDEYGVGSMYDQRLAAGTH